MKRGKLNGDGEYPWSCLTVDEVSDRIIREEKSRISAISKEFYVLYGEYLDNITKPYPPGLAKEGTGKKKERDPSRHDLGL